jgi:hypothetical protein
VSARPTVYSSYDEDSTRWRQLSLRDGDIIISTRSTTGTTWVQMICALLVFRTAELPRPLVELSPWLDWLMRPIDEVVADLEAQGHRRFIKTHTPLDGLPLPGRMRRLADAMGFTITDHELAELATAAGFDAMKARASETAPDFGGIFKAPAGFFRGSSGQGPAQARPETVELYRRRLEETLPPALVTWLDR